MNNRIRQWNMFSLLLVIPIVLLIAPASGEAQTDPIIIEKLVIENQIADLVRREYVDSVDVSVLFDGAIQGMIDKLDPHSSYMPPESYDDFSERIRGNFQGIGITFAMMDDKITVIEVIEGGPSETAGLLSRDRIVTIDGKDVHGIDSEEVKERLRGPAGSRVEVGIERPGQEALVHVTITRDQVDLDSVSHAYMVDDRTGYIALSRFSQYTHYNVYNALDKLKEQGMERLVFDLRGNSGGSLDAAIHVADTFINDGVIVSTEGKKSSESRVWEASGKARYPDIPMIVLIDHSSASASEIVAGALQDHDRALIAGQTSFGKGLVMNPFSLQYQTKQLGTLMLTIARYYTPSGRLIQRPYDGTREEYILEGYDDYDPNENIDTDVNKPVYTTDLGRDVYGGGGITPDRKLTPAARLNAFESELRSTNLVFQFSDAYLLRHNDIPDNFMTFLKDYRIPEDEIERFREFVVESGVTIENETSIRDDIEKLFGKYDLPAEQADSLAAILNANFPEINQTLFDKSIDFIEREIKMEIARMVWNSEARYRVWHQNDTELIETLTFFDEAEDLLRRRIAIGKLDQ